MNLRGNLKTVVIFIVTFHLVIFQPFTSISKEIPKESQKDISVDSALMSEGFDIDISISLKNKMSLKRFVELVVERNTTIQSQDLDFKISIEAIRREKAEFEPEFLTSYQQGGQKVKYSREERASLELFGNELDEFSESYKASIESKVPTGATMKLGLNMKASRDLNMDEGDQYKSFMGFEITQPLLKGGGVAAVANIDAAEVDSDIAFQEYRQKLLHTVLNAVAACWDYYAARETLEIRKNSVRIAEHILKDNRERARLGKMAETEVMEAEAGLAKRKSQEIRAKQDLVSAMNTLHSYISSSMVGIGIDIEFNESLTDEAFTPDFDSSIKKAFLYRPEYLAAKRKVKKEDILVSYGENQRWPQLDLQGSFGLNGLSDSVGDAWHDMFNSDYKTWSVSAMLTIPLMGGLKTKSELNSAKYRRKQALLEMKSVEVDVVNMVDTAIKNAYNTLEQLKYYRNVEKLNQRLLDAELAMLEAGRSNSRSVLEKEEDLIDARAAELDSFVENRKAILLLETAEGILLKKYGIEVMEGES
jgi:outer membrane protein TolC